MQEKSKNILKNVLIIAYICFAILSFVVILVIPGSRKVFEKLSTEHPYVMGFVKFALLATAGELIAGIIVNGRPTVLVKVIWRFIIWGLIGIWITFMMKVYSNAAGYMMQQGIIPGGESKFLRALYTSVFMNTSFAPTFMAIHKCTDKCLELRAKKEPANLSAVIKGIDWTKFVSFTLLITVPCFWIPAHTVTFMLPAQYQVMMAAGLSVALGIILSFGNRKKPVNVSEENQSNESQDSESRESE